MTPCRPVDVSSKEREITVRLELSKDKGPQHSMSRTNSRQATERGPTRLPKTQAASPTTTTPGPSVTLASSTVRPSISFANAASAKTTPDGTMDNQETIKEDTTSAVDNDTV